MKECLCARHGLLHGLFLCQEPSIFSISQCNLPLYLISILTFLLLHTLPCFLINVTVWGHDARTSLMGTREGSRNEGSGREGSHLGGSGRGGSSFRG